MCIPAWFTVLAFLVSGAADGAGADSTFRCSPSLESSCSFGRDSLGEAEALFSRTVVVSEMRGPDGASKSALLVLRYASFPGDGVFFRYDLDPKGRVKSRVCLWRPPAAGTHLRTIPAPDLIENGKLVYRSRCGDGKEFRFSIEDERLGQPEVRTESPCYHCPESPPEIVWFEVPLPSTNMVVAKLRGTASLVDVTKERLTTLQIGSRLHYGGRLVLEPGSALTISVGGLDIQVQSGALRAGIRLMSAPDLETSWLKAKALLKNGTPAIWSPPYLAGGGVLLELSPGHVRRICESASVKTEIPMTQPLPAASNGTTVYLPVAGYAYVLACGG